MPSAKFCKLASGYIAETEAASDKWRCGLCRRRKAPPVILSEKKRSYPSSPAQTNRDRQGGPGLHASQIAISSLMSQKKEI